METHNGYTNYETWTVIAVIDNTKSLYSLFKNEIDECKKEKLNRDEAKTRVYKKVEKIITNMAPKTNNPIWQPIINSTIKDRINCEEIADSLLDSHEFQRH